MNNTNEESNLELLINMYNGKMLLSVKEVSSIVGRSVPSLNRDRSYGVGLPYRKVGNAKNGTVKYSIKDIAKYLDEHSVETL